jgi:hypothetical protein
MTAPLFSINGAAELLERDRRSVQKSLRHVPPDKMVNKQPRWRLATILQALEGLPKAGRNKGSSLGPVVNHNWLDHDNWRSTLISDALIEYNAAFAEMKAIKAIEQRRAFAIKKLAPLIDLHSKNFMAWETDNPAHGKFWSDTDSVCARVSLLWTQEMEAVQAACEWTSDDGRKLLHDPFYEDD